ncbi:hypothetical protein LTR10_017076 [Elasticomyces elasticus]|uniref:Major facilitator superfamily (MFS) profile domain-containing protein n=1 Tax=Exophiala sideris TaxID=1016849 RepID=A0ABR0JG20_9EURO|nr:hypothetical protein LTR10_017076 [Elasticomyces elasticus]KAK5032624.1 hypothetical protein LTS07_004034 [Exophiala sideris]KAK5037195.1 hypothetical protein LTR13_005000 [Exophiala sideris]KAK5062149.1 hypothetical protein LTR69_004507 [Exophiala sideris]KAK5182353.1 hypothetical protein LTR44_005364 [Eurotiomycetes sp. CCFEE 6388]
MHEKDRNTATPSDAMPDIKTPSHSPSRTAESPVDADAHHAQAKEMRSTEKDQEDKYPPLPKVLLIMSSLYLANFLVALDLTIIGTATPQISDDFHALGDIGWYGSAYLLTLCCFQLLLGRIYTFYSPKFVFLGAVIFFEVGSALCGAAPNSTAFIFGRAIAGIGSAGISSGAIVIMMHTTPIEKRPLYMSLVGVVFGVASVAGPLLGGVFTSKLTWRWCFYINLPIGGLTMGIILLVLNLPNPLNAPKTIKEQLGRLDPLGALFLFPGIICLLLALQWGGSTYAWGNARIIVLLIVFGLCMIAFIAVQRHKGDAATVPPHIFFQRSILSGAWFTLCSGSALMIMLYYLPIWFQAIKGASAVKSGVMTIPIILALVVSNLLCGITVTKIGYYTPFMIASTVFMSVGAGLLSTFTTTTDHSKWIAYQFLFGFGIGCGMQQPGVAAQAVLQKKDVPIGVSLLFFFRNLGGALFLSIAENVFENELIGGLKHIPGLDGATILRAGATGMRKVIDPQYVQEVLVVYNGALVKVYYCAVAVSVASIIGSLTMEWRNVKKVREQQRMEMEKMRAKNEAKKEKDAC